MMVCVGQAGNQIGSATAIRTGPISHPELAAAAIADRDGAATKRVKPSGFVFVDSEPKVVRGIVQEGASTHLPFVSLNGSIVWDHNGRGNNWAWGYTGLASHVGRASLSPAGEAAGASATGSAGQPLWKRAIDAIRRQAEVCELGMSAPSSTLVFAHSLGGGTGSGLGSRLLEVCRDEFPKCVLSSS